MKLQTLSFLEKYKNEVVRIINNLDNSSIISLKKKILQINKISGKVYIFGNGGSISTANHVSVDLTKNAKINSICPSGDNMITCFSNDYGYDLWMQKYAEYYITKKDLVLILSCSGKSKNLINLAKYCKSKNYNLFALTGFKKNNKINTIIENKIWINSKSYNIIELSHFYILISIIDLIIGKFEYSSKL